MDAIPWEDIADEPNFTAPECVTNVPRATFEAILHAAPRSAWPPWWPQVPSDATTIRCRVGTMQKLLAADAWKEPRCPDES